MQRMEIEPSSTSSIPPHLAPQPQVEPDRPAEQPQAQVERPLPLQSKCPDYPGFMLYVSAVSDLTQVKTQWNQTEK